MIFAITGHQPHLLGGYDADARRRLAGFACAALVKQGATEVVSGLAAGWDMATAKAALALGLPLVVALAHPKQGRNWPDDVRAEMDDVVSRAVEVKLVGERNTSECWAARDRWVVARGDALLALWNGGDGGTAGAVAMARELGRPVINVWDEWSALAVAGPTV